MQMSSPRAGAPVADALPDLRGLAREFFARHPGVSAESEGLIVERLEARLPEVTDRVVLEIRARIAAYANIDEAEIRSAVFRLVGAVLLHAKTAEAPGRELLEPFEEHARLRTFDGLPLDALLEAVHLTSRNIIAAVDEEMLRAGVPTEGLVEMRDLAWDWVNGITSTIARMHGQLEEQRVRRERARRTEFIRTLLLGTYQPDRLRANAARFGLALDRPYIPVCSRPSSRRDALEIASAILRTGGDGELSPIVETLDGDLVGLTPARPDVSGHLVAIGEPLVLAHVHEAFADACAALDAAHAFEMTGTLALEDLGPRPLVVAAERAACRLDQRLLAAFPDGPEPTEIERTVHEYLANDQDAETTAKGLCVHVNTIRYRLGRFRELTGLDLRRTEDLVAVWWLLNRRAAGRREDAVVPSGLRPATARLSG